MEPNPTNGELAIMLKGLAKELGDGFKVMHDKQDKTNGTVKENSEHRIQQKNTNRWMYGILTLVIIPIIALVYDKLA